MKTQGDYIAPLMEELEKLSVTDLQLRAEDVLLVLQEHSPFRLEAAQACEQFAQSREWPAMRDIVRWDVICRIRCAIAYCEDKPGAVSSDETFQEFLVSLLVDYWEDVGWINWVTEEILHQKGPY